MGEHLPCKQGVKSSNLSVSTSQINESEEMYLENFIQPKNNDDKINIFFKTSKKP